MQKIPYNLYSPSFVALSLVRSLVLAITHLTVHFLHISSSRIAPLLHLGRTPNTNPRVNMKFITATAAASMAALAAAAPAWKSYQPHQSWNAPTYGATSISKYYPTGTSVYSATGTAVYATGTAVYSATGYSNSSPPGTPTYSATGYSSSSPPGVPTYSALSSSSSSPPGVPTYSAGGSSTYSATQSATAPTTSSTTGSQHCGTWDTVTSGSYTVNADQWGVASASSGSQCFSVNSMSGGALSWSTS